VDANGRVLQEPFIAAPGFTYPAGTLPAPTPTITSIVVLPGDLGWFAYEPTGSAAQIDATNPRAGRGSLELLSGIGANAAFIHDPTVPALGTFDQVSSLSFDCFIDPPSSAAMPPALAPRVYPFRDPRSAFRRCGRCRARV